MDAQLVLDAPDAHRLVRFQYEKGEPAGIVAALLGARQHHDHIGAAIGDKALDAMDAPHPSRLVPGGPRLHRAQVRACIRLGEGHGPGHLAPRKTGQQARLDLIIGELGDSGRDFLQAKDVHQPCLGARDDLHHHLKDRLRQVQAAILPGKHGPHELGLHKEVQRLLRCRRIGHLPIVVVRPLLVGLGGPRRHIGAAQLTQDVQQQSPAIRRIRIVARCIGVLVVGPIAVLQDVDDLGEVQLLQAVLQIAVIGEKILWHSPVSPYFTSRFSR